MILLFFGLAFIHFYWAFGGQWGFDNALPANEKGEIFLAPTALDCIVVGVVLLIFGLFYLFLGNAIKANLRYGKTIEKIILVFIPLVFVIRAIGDFKYVGFFKQLSSTEFAYYDTVFYSPLCLVIVLLGVVKICWRDKL